MSLTKSLTDASVAWPVNFGHRWELLYQHFSEFRDATNIAQRSYFPRLSPLSKEERTAAFSISKAMERSRHFLSLLFPTVLPKVAWDVRREEKRKHVCSWLAVLSNGSLFHLCPASSAFTSSLPALFFLRNSQCWAYRFPLFPFCPLSMQSLSCLQYFHNICTELRPKLAPLFLWMQRWGCEV